MLDPMNIYRDPVKIRLIDDPGLFAVHFDSVLPAAIGFGAGLLGSRGGGGGSGPSVATTQQDVLRPGQISSIDKLTGFLNPQIGQAPRVPGTQLGPVGPGALQQQAFGLAQQLPGQMQFDPQQITSAMQPVGDYAINLFQNRISPDIMNTLGGAGVARSSGAAEVLGRAGTGLAAELPDPDNDSTVDSVVITIQATADVAVGTGINIDSLVNLMITMMIVVMMMKMMTGAMQTIE